eukprot:jgi/Tetstr1/464106/TSEL_008911.t1
MATVTATATATRERQPGVYVCGKTGDIVYRYISDSPYTKAGLNRMSPCGRTLLYAESVARPSEAALQRRAHVNRGTTTVTVRKNWSGMSFDTDVPAGTFRHTGRVVHRERGRGRTIRCFELELVE